MSSPGCPHVPAALHRPGPVAGDLALARHSAVDAVAARLALDRAPRADHPWVSAQGMLPSSNDPASCLLTGCPHALRSEVPSAADGGESGNVEGLHHE